MTCSGAIFHLFVLELPMFTYSIPRKYIFPTFLGIWLFQLSKKMKLITFVAFFLLISSTQATPTSDFNTNFTSEGMRSLIQSRGQAQELLGNLYGSGSIDHSTRFNDKVEKSENEHKHELSVATKKAHGGTAGGGRRGNAGVTGGASVNRRPRSSRNSAPSLLSGPHCWVSTFILYASLALIIFLFH